MNEAARAFEEALEHANSSSWPDVLGLVAALGLVVAWMAL